MKNLFLKFKWWILSWVVYAFWVFAALSNYRYRLDSEEKGLWVFWAVIVPLVIYLFYNLYKYFKGKREGRRDSFSKDGSNSVAAYKGSIWLLMEFAKEHGSLQMQVNSEGKWNRFRFADGTEGYIANVLKDYSAEEIRNNKERISIRVLESGDYCMCLEWEDVEI